MTVVFSLSGMQSSPVRFITLLLKTTGAYTLELKDSTDTIVQTLQGQGTGAFEFALFKHVDLGYPNIIQIHVTSSEVVHIYEVNTAEICLCGSEEC